MAISDLLAAQVHSTVADQYVDNKKVDFDNPFRIIYLIYRTSTEHSLVSRQLFMFVKATLASLYFCFHYFSNSIGNMKGSSESKVSFSRVKKYFLINNSTEFHVLQRRFFRFFFFFKLSFGQNETSRS